jgi:CubicO group peptidase (beta-lactamase class C family)
MKSVLKTVLQSVLVLMGLIILVVTLLAIKYSPRYVYRLALYNVADVYDYTHFENRTIRASSNTFSFPVHLDEVYVESLFQEKVTAYGFSSLDEWAEKSNTTALIVVRRDTILYEKYFNGFGRESYFHSQSMAKSFISTLIGFAIEDGYIQGVDDPMTQYIPELLERDERFARITLKHLLTMQSGIKYNEAYLPWIGIHAPWHDEAVGYYHGNVRRLLLKRVKIAGEPGQRFQYNNYNTSYLGLIIERATGMTVSEYLEEKLWSQVMEYDALFSIDSKRSGFEYMPSRLMARAIDYARFGRLFLHEGSWNGDQLLSREWVQEATREDHSLSRKRYPEWMGDGANRTYYSYQWWGHVNGDSTYRFFASGNLGQDIYVMPAEETIIVHCGNSLDYYNADMLRSVADRMNL